MSHEEADTQMKVNGVTGSLYAAAEFKCNDAQHVTQQGDGHSFDNHFREEQDVLENETEESNKRQ